MKPPRRLAEVSQASCVVMFPAFELYAEKLRGWLDELDETDVPARSASALMRAMRKTLSEVERVRNSQRHQNLANFVRHASVAMENAEFDGARYILTAALALSDAKFRYEGEAGSNLRQFPGATVKLPVDVTTGMALG